MYDSMAQECRSDLWPCDLHTGGVRIHKPGLGIHSWAEPPKRKFNVCTKRPKSNGHRVETKSRPSSLCQGDHPLFHQFVSWETNIPYFDSRRSPIFSYLRHKTHHCYNPWNIVYPNLPSVWPKGNNDSKKAECFKQTSQPIKLNNVRRCFLHTLSDSHTGLSWV